MLAIFTFLLLASVGWMAWPQTEPQFQGMPASDYAQSILRTNYYNVTLTTNLLAPMGREVAVSAITTVLAREDSPWKHRYRKILPRAPLWLQRWVTTPRFDGILIASCIRALGAYGPEAKPAVRTLAKSLDQGDDFIKMNAAEALSCIGPEASAAIPSLLASAMRTGLGKSNLVVAAPGTRAFAGAGLTDGHSTLVSLHLSEALYRIGPDARAGKYSQLTSVRWQTPENPQSQARAAAVHALADVDPTGKRSAPKLAALLNDPEPAVVAAVTSTLGSMAQHSPSLVPRLHSALEHSQLQVCLMAALHLKKLHALTLDDVEPFIRGLQSNDAVGRAFSAAVLMYAQPFEKDVMPALVQAAPDTNAVVREAAVNSLTLYAYDPTVSHPHRVAAAKAVLQYGSPEQAWKMLNWLPQFLPEEGGTVPLLIVALSSNDERTRGRVAKTLGELGVLARDAVPALTQLRTDEWLHVREAATNALKTIDSSVP